MRCALSLYPLGDTFRAGLEQVVSGPLTYLSLQELKQLPALTAFLRLHRLRPAELMIPLENDAERVSLPLLSAVAALTRVSRVQIIQPNFARATVRCGSAMGAALSVGWASWLSLMAAAGDYVHLTYLLRAARRPRRAGPLHKILYLNANLWLAVKAGGSVGHVAGVANQLQARGRRVTYATAGGRGTVASEIPLITLRPPSVFGVPYELTYYRFGRIAERQVSEQSPEPFDCIYQRLSIGNFSGVRLSRRWGVPLVLEYNGSETWTSRHWGRRLQFERLAVGAENASLRHAHVVVTVSEVLREELIARGVEPSRIAMYPNCIDPGTFDPADHAAAGMTVRNSLSIPADGLVVTFIGTFGDWHGAEVLASAIANLVLREAARLRERKVTFVLVGDGVRMPAVRRILTPECAPFVRLTGLLPQLQAPSYLAASDVVVSPHVGNADGSRFFGSPTKLFEYMGMGKAIVASDVEQIGEVLRNSLRAGALPSRSPAADDHQLAITCPPGDVAALEAALLFAVESDQWRAVLGANARREALARYTWRHHVDKILSVLEQPATESGSR